MLQGVGNSCTAPTRYSLPTTEWCYPASCVYFKSTADQEQVLLSLISIPRELRQHIQCYSSIIHTFFYLNCKLDCALLLGNQVYCSHCLCACPLVSPGHAAYKLCLLPLAMTPADCIKQYLGRIATFKRNVVTTCCIKEKRIPKLDLKCIE